MERANCTVKMQRNGDTRNKNKTIVLKFLNFKDKSRILNAYGEKKAMEKSL